MLDLLVLLFLLSILHGFFLIYSTSNQYEAWFDSKRMLFLLLLWSIFGLLLGLEQTSAWGCVISPLDLFTTKNILLSGISIGFLFLAFQTKNVGRQIFLGIAECLFWVGKLLLFKGGYAVGITASADLFVLGYDTLSLYTSLFVIGLGVQKQGFSLWKIAAAVQVVMAVKVIFFATPATLVYEQRWEMEKAEEAHRFLLGDWKGDMIEGNKITECSKSEVLISINEKSVSFTGTDELRGEYQLILYGAEDGSLLSFESFDHHTLMVKYISVDSLAFVLSDREQRFQFSLDRIIE